MTPDGLMIGIWGLSFKSLLVKKVTRAQRRAASRLTGKTGGLGGTSSKHWERGTVISYIHIYIID